MQLKLKNPVEIDGKKVSELIYDEEEITSILFAQAEAKRKTAAGIRNISVTPSAEFDFGLHLYLGFAAIIAVNPKIDWSDLERIKGRDVVNVMGIGRNFMLKSESEQTVNESGEQPETMQESTTQAQQNLKEKE